jgi:ribosomal-protein-alanine N-acetyltransferase
MAARFRTRPARPADLAAVAAIEARSFGDPWPEAAFRSYLDGCFLVSESEGGRITGYLVARAAADEAEILDLAVEPPERRHGVGRQLLTDALARLEMGGARRVYLEVRESNAAALALYGALGFRPVGRRSRYYREPTEDALVLALETRSDA